MSDVHPPLRVDLVDLPDDRPFLVAGPCVIETEDHCLRMADRIGRIADRLEIPYIFKASFDKANRTSIHSYRGPGLEDGLRILQRVKSTTGRPVLTDFHETAQVPAVAAVADVLQIPAFLCRQTDLIVTAARTGRIVNIKKGQFMAPWDMKHSVAKAREAGGRAVWLTERGTCFGYNNLVNDMRALVELHRLACPVLFDATHSVQIPGGGTSSGGRRELIGPLLRAAVAVGVDGIFMEVHDQADQALCDGPNAMPLEHLEPLLQQVLAIDRARRRSGA